MKSHAAHLSDSQFLLEMKGTDVEILRPIIRDIEVLSHSILSSVIDTTVGAMTRAVTAMKQDVFKLTIQHEIKSEEMKYQNEALKEFIRKLNARLAGRNNSSVVYIDSIATLSNGWGDSDCASPGWNSRPPNHSQEYSVTGRREVPKDHELEFRVHLMNLLSDDIQKLQSDAKYIPSPIVIRERSALLPFSHINDHGYCVRV